MSFALPAALALAAIALPIIALYVLKVRLRRVKVSTNLFWKQIFEDKPPRSLWQNLRHLISLLVQLLLLILLVLAAADPYFSWQAFQARRMVVVLDTSASMKANDIKPSRFEAARSAVHRLLDGLRFRDEVAIVSAGPQPDVVLGMTGHTPTLRRALDSLKPNDTGSALEPAIELAKELIGEHPHGYVLVFSDGCAQRPSQIKTTSLEHFVHDRARLLTEDSPEIKHAVDPEKPSPAGEKTMQSSGDQRADAIPVIYQTLATAAGNVGITQLHARRSLIDPIGYEILVTLRNASDLRIQGRLELELEEIPIDVIPFQLEPNQTWTRSLEKTSLAGGTLRASLRHLVSSDQTLSTDKSFNMLPRDDEAWAIVPPRNVQDVLIVSPGNLFLRKVFEANPLVRLQVLDQLPDQWPANTLVVLHRLIPERLPAGQVFVVDPESDSTAWKLGELVENPIVTEQAQDSLLMAHIHLDNVLLPRVRRIEFKEPVVSLASALNGETIYALLHRADGPCLVLTVNLEQSDLAFRTSFPIMIANALNWFAGQPGELQQTLAGGQLATLAPKGGSLKSRQPATHERPADTDYTAVQTEWRLISPSGLETPIISNQIGPLCEVGVWTVASAPDNDSGGRREVWQRYAVNLANAAESDLRPEKGTELLHATQPLLASSWLSRPLWFYLIVLATLACTLEWILYQRRIIS